jgi:hypothetical protein
MNRVFFTAGLLSLLAFPAFGQAAGCGLQPLTPLGCDADRAVCACNAAGSCQWIFECGRGAGVGETRPGVRYNDGSGPSFLERYNRRTQELQEQRWRERQLRR